MVAQRRLRFFTRIAMVIFLPRRFHLAASWRGGCASRYSRYVLAGLISVPLLLGCACTTFVPFEIMAEIVSFVDVSVGIEILHS